jgi:D-alanyl-D-alanine carboxypeptidase
MKKLIALVILVSLAICFYYFKEIDTQNMLNDWAKSNSVQEVVVVLDSQGNEKIWVSGASEEKLNQETELTETLFWVGSITKTFVSAAILKLEAEGKLNINDTIGDYLKRYPKWSHITIKQLLNMTSGIPNYGADTEYKNSLENNFQNKQYNTSELIHIAYDNLEQENSGKWRYSNTDYLLLSEIIQEVTKQPLAQYFENVFFKPLGLDHTFYSEISYPEEIIKKIAHGSYNGKSMTMLSPQNYGAAGGGMLMSTSDLQKWITALLIDKSVLSSRQIIEMLNGVKTIDMPLYPENTEFGLGLFISTKGEPDEMIWYTGVIPGYSSTFVWMPHKEVALIIQVSLNRKNDINFNLLFPNEELTENLLHQIYYTKH